MKKVLCFIIVFMLMPCMVYAVDVSAESAILYDSVSGKVLYEKNADKKSLIASTTKIMTGLLSVELYDLDESVVIDRQWCGIEGSSMYLAAGEAITIRDLLYGLLLMSGNDAAQALSCLYTGDSKDFVDLMNKRAKEIGLTDTHFSNPSGLDDKDHYSTAHDMALLAYNALQNKDFAKICATKQIEIANRFMTNHNKLLFLIPGASGVKTGYTDEAGRCLVSSVTREGRTLIAVTLNAPNDWNDHEKLYDMGFYDMRFRDIVKKGLVGYAYAAGKGMVELHTNNDIIFFMTAKEIDNLDIILKGDRIVYGSHKKGEKYGEINVLLDGAVICTEPVYYSEDIEEEPEKFSFWDKIKGILS